MKEKLVLLVLCLLCVIGLTSCESSVSGAKLDVSKQNKVGDTIAENQPTPTDLEYSLERYNLIKRAYWVNGQREKAIALPCGITKPLGYIVLFSETGVVIGQFTVDGKVSYLNSWLTPDYYTDYKGSYGYVEYEMSDVDGTYGDNSDGIFFFTTDNKYIEWTGTYLYSDIPFQVDNTLLGGY